MVWVHEWHKNFTKFLYFSNCSLVFSFWMKYQSCALWDKIPANFRLKRIICTISGHAILIWFFLILLWFLNSVFFKKKTLWYVNIFAIVHRYLVSGQKINHEPCGIKHPQILRKKRAIWPSLRHAICTGYF